MSDMVFQATLVMVLLYFSMAIGLWIPYTVGKTLALVTVRALSICLRRHETDFYSSFGPDGPSMSSISP